jgi:hypothetical protein
MRSFCLGIKPSVFTCGSFPLAAGQELTNCRPPAPSIVAFSYFSGRIPQQNLQSFAENVRACGWQSVQINVSSSRIHGHPMPHRQTQAAVRHEPESRSGTDGRQLIIAALTDSENLVKIIQQAYKIELEREQPARMTKTETRLKKTEI